MQQEFRTQHQPISPWDGTSSPTQLAVIPGAMVPGAMKPEAMKPGSLC